MFHLKLDKYSHVQTEGTKGWKGARGEGRENRWIW